MCLEIKAFFIGENTAEHTCRCNFCRHSNYAVPPSQRLGNQSFPECMKCASGTSMVGGTKLNSTLAAYSENITASFCTMYVIIFFTRHSNNEGLGKILSLDSFFLLSSQQSHFCLVTSPQFYYFYSSLNVKVRMHGRSLHIKLARNCVKRFR